jgi:hypothetical protein
VNGVRHGVACALALLALLAAPLAQATCSHADFLNALGFMESSLIPTKVNSIGYAGLFQMGEDSLQDTGYYRGDKTRKNDWTGSWTGKDGINSLADFLKSPETQVNAIVAYHAQIWRYLQKNADADSVLGKTIGGVVMTKSGMIAGAHLVGMGAFSRFVNSNGAYIPKDGNKVPATRYASDFGGCDIGTTSPGVAAVMAGARTSAGVGGAPVDATPETTSAPDPYAGNPEGAFQAATGRSSREVRELVGLIVASLLTTWLAWTAASHLQSWRRGLMSLLALKWDIVRGCMVLSVMILMLQ